METLPQAAPQEDQQQEQAGVYYVDSGNPFAEPLPYDAEGSELSGDAASEFAVAEPDAHGKELSAAIFRSAGGDTAPIEGTADREQRYLPVDENGIAYVAMNTAGYTLLGPGEEGHIATAGLTGCTGVAGFTTYADGSTAQLTSHYGAYAQSAEAAAGLDSPINEHMSNFDAQQANPISGAERDAPAQYVVAYYAGAQDDPDYGVRHGEFKDWHYLDQIQATASALNPESSTLFLPYRGMHTLAAGRDGSGEGIYWDGMRIDPTDAASVAATPGAVVVHGSGQTPAETAAAPTSNAI